MAPASNENLCRCMSAQNSAVQTDQQVPFFRPTLVGDTTDSVRKRNDAKGYPRSPCRDFTYCCPTASGFTATPSR